MNIRLTKYYSISILLFALIMYMTVLFTYCKDNSIVKAAEIEDLAGSSATAKMLTNSYGIIGSLTSVSESGAFGIDINPSSGKGHFIFYDFASKTVSLFPQNNTNEQEGVIESVVGGAVPISAEEGLYVIRLGYPFDEMTPPTIYFFGNDGLEQSRFVLPEQFYISPSTCIAQYDGYLILALARYDYDTRNLVGTDIVKINPLKKELHVIYSFDGSNQYTIVEAYDDEVIVEKTERLEERQKKNTYKTAYILSLSEESIISTSDKWSINEYSRAYKKSEIYYISPKNENIIHYSLKQGTKTIIGSVTEYGANPQIVGIYDDRLMIRLDNEDRFGLYFDLNTKKLNKLTLPVGIIGETETSFFIATGEKKVDYKQEINGRLVESSMGVVEYALISKVDYWANKPNYQPFSDTVYTSGMIYRENEN